jgi:hypothetical protein
MSLHCRLIFFQTLHSSDSSPNYLKVKTFAIIIFFVCAARVPEPAEAGGSNPGVIHQEQRMETHAKQEPTQESAQSGDSGEQFLHLKC